MNEFEICKKTKFLREVDAQDSIKRYRKSAKDPVKLWTYFCNRCKCWHLTSQQPKLELMVENLKNEIQKLKDKGELQTNELTYLKKIIKEKNIEISELKYLIKNKHGN